MAQETLGEVRDGSGDTSDHRKIRNGWGGPLEGLGCVGLPLRRFVTGRGALPKVQDRSEDPR